MKHSNNKVAKRVIFTEFHLSPSPSLRNMYKRYYTIEKNWENETFFQCVTLKLTIKRYSNQWNEFNIILWKGRGERKSKFQWVIINQLGSQEFTLALQIILHLSLIKGFINIHWNYFFLNKLYIPKLWLKDSLTIVI